MTETEWLQASEPLSMLEHLKGSASERKLRLFGALGLWEYVRFRPDLRNGICPRWANITEQYADGEVGFEDWNGVRTSVHGTFHDVDPHQQAMKGVDWALACCDHEPSESLLLAEFLRDLFGNPFRPVPLDPSWLTSDVVAIARGIYQDREFQRMPMLADALQDAGCCEHDLLEHCRQPIQHVRGCWVVDLVTKRE